MHRPPSLTDCYSHQRTAMSDQSAARKRQKGLQGQPIELSLAHPQANAPPPALGSSTLSPSLTRSVRPPRLTAASHPPAGLFPSTQPPAKTPFTLYTPSGDAPSADQRGSRALLAAETEEIEYDSRNHIGNSADGEAQGYAVQCVLSSPLSRSAPGPSGSPFSARNRYMLGVHNPRTNTLTLHSAPLHSFTPVIKSLKGATAASDPAAALYTAQRAALGSAFGTKKAQAQQRAQERNKLSMSSFGTDAAVAGLQSHLQQTIQAQSGSLPSAKDIEDDANARRPIPPFNLAAETPGDVYDLDAVVSPAELHALDISALISAPDFKERRLLLPYRRSDWVLSKLRQLLPARASAEGNVPNPSKRDRERLRLVVHVAHLFAFRQAARPGKPVERAHLVDKLGHPSAAVVDALIERYTEPTRGTGGDEQRQVTSTMELKLLGYMLVAILKVDGWTTDVTTIADDLAIGNKRCVPSLFPTLASSRSSADSLSLSSRPQRPRALPLARLRPRRPLGRRPREAHRDRPRDGRRRRRQEQEGDAQGPARVPQGAPLEGQEVSGRARAREARARTERRMEQVCAARRAAAGGVQRGLDDRHRARATREGCVVKSSAHLDESSSEGLLIEKGPARASSSRLSCALTEPRETRKGDR